MKLEIIYSELSIIRMALNRLFDECVLRYCPIQIRKHKDNNNFFKWLLIQERDKMSDFYYIKTLREKINKVEQIFAKSLKGK